MTKKDNLYAANRQWSTRPADERFWGLQDLASHLEKERAREQEKKICITDVQAIVRGEDILLRGPEGKPATLTNWSFGQLCKKANGAPASYLQGLPAKLATTCLNHGLSHRSTENDPDDNAECKLLLHRNGGLQVRAITGPNYSRIWDERVIKSIQPALDLGWRIPPARPAVADPRARKATKADILPNQEGFALSVKVGDMIAPAGVYRGDRDMFIFLVNPERIIDDGNQGLMRGVFISNSEVGAKSFRVQCFLMENVCGNHICWSANVLTDLRLIHRGKANERFQGEMRDQLRQYHTAKSVPEEEMIVAAKKYRLGKDRDEVIENVFDMKALLLNKNHIAAAFDLAEQWEHTALAAPVTIWGFVHGLTRYSQTLAYADARDEMDQAGGKLLEKAVALAS